MIKTPWHVGLVRTIVVLFNGVGAFDYLMNIVQGGSYLASAGMNTAQVAHFQAMPGWMILVWTVGVWGALLGSVLILLRRRLALPVFTGSLAAFAISLVYHRVLTDVGTLMGSQGAVTDAVIAALLLFFLGYSRWMTLRGVFR